MYNNFAICLPCHTMPHTHLLIILIFHFTKGIYRPQREGKLIIAICHAIYIGDRYALNLLIIFMIRNGKERHDQDYDDDDDYAAYFG